MHYDRPTTDVEAQLARAVERNARLIVMIRTLAHEVHTNRPGHQAVSNFTKCLHPTCGQARDVIHGNVAPTAAPASA